MNCINIKSKEFKSLQEESNLPVMALEFQVASWQQTNNTDEFPTYSELLGINESSHDIYNGSESLMEIGTVQEFSNFLNGREINEYSPNVAKEFQEYVADKPLVKNITIDESFDDVSNTTGKTVDKVKGSKSLKPLFDDLSRDKVESFNNNVLFKEIFNNSNDINATYVLLNLLNNKGLSKEAQQVVKNMINTTDVTFVNSSELGGRLMAYDPTTKQVLVDFSILGQYNALDISSVILHELAHARSLNALNDPKTDNEVQFSKTVSDFFNTFKGYSDSYGWTSVEEFVAEIYSNEGFRNEVREAGGNGKQGFWSRFIDSLRRLFGLAKTSKSEEVISTIISHVDSNNNVDAIANSPLFYAPANLALDGTITNLEKKISKLRDHMLDSIDSLENMNDYIVAETASGVLSAKSRKELYDETRNIIENVTEYDLEGNVINVRNRELFESFDAVFGYIKMSDHLYNSVYKGLENVINGLLKTTVSENGVLSDSRLDSIEQFMYVYNQNDMISEVVENMEQEFTIRRAKAIQDNDTTTLEEINERLEDFTNLRRKLFDINAKFAQINTMIENQRRKAFIKLGSADTSLHLIPQFETSARAELRNVWDRDRKVKGTVANGFDTFGEFVNHMLETDEWKSRRKQYVADILDDASEDISTFDLNWQDSLNIDNSPLIGMALNLVAQMRNSIITDSRKTNREIALLEKEFSKVRKGKPSEQFKNIIDTDGQGNYYLKTKYSAKFNTDFSEMIRKVVRNILGIVDIIETPLHEVLFLENKNTRSILVREQSDTAFKTGEKVTIRNDKANREYNVNVDNSEYVDSVDNLTEYEQDMLAQQYGYGSYAEFKQSVQFRDKSSFAKKEPLMHQFLTGRKGATIVRLTKIKQTDEIKKGVNSNQEYKDWVKDNTVIIKGKRYPADKYLNDLSKLTDVEKRALELFTSITNIIKDDRPNGSKLQVSKGGINHEFIKLPTLNKTQREFILEGDGKGLTGAIRRDFGKIEADDYEYGSRIDNQGRVIQQPRVHFRGYIDPKHQSLDLFTLFRMEAVNGHTYNKKQQYISRFNTIKEAAGGKKYAAKSTITGRVLQNVFKKRAPGVEIEGRNSNEYKKILGIIESNVLDVSHYKAGKIANMDLNKIMGTISGFAASAALTANIHGGVANAMNGFTQLFIDSFGGHHFSMSDLASAENEYRKETGSLIKDLGNPNKEARANQLMEVFDTWGGFSVEQQSYLYNNFYKKLFSRQNMNGLNEVGEHAMTSVIMYAVMKGVKVMDSNNRFIDKEGNVVKSEKEAASLFDMIDTDEDGRVQFKTDLFTYTTHTPSIAFDTAAAKGQISLLIKKKMHDMFGAYDSNYTAEISKEFYGQSILMFKKYLLPGISARYKGLMTGFIPSEKLKDSDRRYNAALKQYEEGYYVTFMRYTFNSLRELVKSGSFGAFKGYYREMSDYERSNLRKTLMEIGITAMILPLLRFLTLLAFDDDDNDASLWFAIYQMRRLEQELAQFRNPLEINKILQNPIAVARYIQNVLEFSYEVVTPINPVPEDDESWFSWIDEDQQGNNKMAKKLSRVTPFGSPFYRDWKRMYNYID